MNRDCFWLTGAQFAKLEPHLPADTRGKPGVVRQHSAQGQPHLEELLLAPPLPRPQRYRAHVLRHQGLPAHRNPVRPKRNQLPRSRSDRRERCILL